MGNQNLQFTILLPLEKFPENTLIVNKEANAIIENQTQENDLPIVLIADDNAEIRTVLKDVLKGAAFGSATGAAFAKIGQQSLFDFLR